MRDRVREIMIRENLTAAQLAKIIDINASTISHITLGRSNPKLDFVQKILTHFPQLNPNWVILGQGEMYQSNKNKYSEQRLFEDDELFKDVVNESSSQIISVEIPVEEKKEKPITSIKKNVLGEVQEDNLSTIMKQQVLESNNKKIDRILVFYSNKTYEEYIIKA